MFRLIRHAFWLVPGVAATAVATAIANSVCVVAQPLLLGQTIGRLPAALADVNTTVFIGFLLATLGSVALAQLLRTPQPAIADLMSAACEKDTLLRLNRLTTGHPNQAALDDPALATRIRQVWERQREIAFGMFRASGEAIEQVLALVGTGIALGFVLTWWVPLVLAAGAVGCAVLLQRTVQSEFDVWAGASEPQKHVLYAYRAATGDAAKEIRIFGLGAYFRQRLRDFRYEALAPYWRRRKVRAAINLATQTGRVALGVGAVAYSGWLATAGRLDLAGLATVIPLILAMTGQEL